MVSPATAPKPAEYRPSRVRMAVLSLILFSFDVGYVWMLATPGAKSDDRVLGAVGLLLFGPAFAATLGPLFRPRALLRLDAEGLQQWGHFGGENLRLAWSEIAHAEPFRWRFVPMLELVPFDRERTLANASSSMRKAARGAERTYGRPFVIDARLYGGKVDDLAAEIERWLALRPSIPVAYPRPERLSAGNVPR